MVGLGDLLDSSLMLIKGDMVGVVKLVQGFFLLKLSCMDMEATELVGLLASPRGLNSPSEDSLTSLILLGSLLTM